MSTDVYERQGFGQSLPAVPPFGLLIVDFVNGFADPDMFGGGNIPQSISQTVRLLEHARKEAWPIAFSRVVFADDGADANVFSIKVPSILALTEDAPASAIVPGLAPRPRELIIRKTTPSAFFDTAAATWFTYKKVSTIVVAGCTTSGCVRASVVDAMSAGFRPLVVSDCVGDRAIEPHEASLFDMAQKYAAVMPLAEVLPYLAAHDRVA